MSTPLHLLLVTDRLDELDRLQQLLRGRDDIHLQHSGNRADAGQRLRDRAFDAVLLCCDRARPDDRLLEQWLQDLDPLGPPLLKLLRQPPANDDAGELALPALDASRLTSALSRALEQHRAGLRLLRLAQTDPLTGLASPIRFRQQLADTLARARRNGERCALIFIDLDQFGAINHALGADSGDDLLGRVGERLAGSIRESDLAARLGSDNFAVLASGLHQPLDAARVAQQLMCACRMEGDSELGEWRLEASAGIALFPEDGDSPEQLQQHAAQALARAQRESTGLCFANAGLDALHQTHKALGSDIGHALLRGEMELRYQPLFDLRARRIAQVEVLLRWRHPLHGLLSPRYFLPLAQSSGAIHPLGSWIVRQACEQRRAWRRRGLPATALSFNVSTCQLERDTLVGTLRRLAREGAAEDGGLGLELAETTLAGCSDSQRDLLGELHAEGIRLTADQFDGGHCTPAQLQRLPLDAIKFRRSVTASLQRDGGRTIDSMIRLCRALDCQAVAAGVERAVAASQLSRRHCDQIQGFFVSRPLMAEEFPLWAEALAARSPGAARGSPPAG